MTGEETNMTDKPKATPEGEAGERAKCSRHGFQRFFDCPECLSLEAGKHPPIMSGAPSEPRNPYPAGAVLEVGATEIEGDAAAAPPVVAPPLTLEISEADDPKRCLFLPHDERDERSGHLKAVHVRCGCGNLTAEVRDDTLQTSEAELRRLAFEKYADHVGRVEPPIHVFACEQCRRGVALDADGSKHVVGGAGGFTLCRAAYNVTLEDDNAGTAFARALMAARAFAKTEGVAFVVYAQGFRYLVRRASLKLTLEGAHVAQTVEPSAADFFLCEDCSRGVPLSADGSNHFGTGADEDGRPCRAGFDLPVREGGYPAAMKAALDFASLAARIEQKRFGVWEVTTGFEHPSTAKMRLCVRREPFNFPPDLLRQVGAKAKVAKTVEPMPADDPEETLPVAEPEDGATKREMILRLWDEGTRDIADIVRRVKARPSYVAQVLQQAGHLDGFFDLYTTTGREQNVYTRYFRNVLHFRNVEAARESVARIDRLYNYFERLGDRAGQHQAMILALTGKNRARWSGKLEESQVFSDWLNSH